jgi:hypothetical protein
MQLLYKVIIEFLNQGMDNHGARRQISELLGDARIDVTYKYVPKGFLVPEDNNK